MKTRKEVRQKPQSYADLTNEELLGLYHISVLASNMTEEERKYLDVYYVVSSDAIRNIEVEILRRMGRKF
jgi:hypothetical protein